MRSESRIGPNGRDDDLTRVLRAAYAAPPDPTYWDVLERKIMARIRGEGEGWWQPLSGWGPLGLLAAGLALAVAGLTLTRVHEAEARLAYQMVMETPRVVPQELAVAREGTPAREATLRFVVPPIGEY
jgi:hypothetical protein